MVPIARLPAPEAHAGSGAGAAQWFDPDWGWVAYAACVVASARLAIDWCNFRVEPLKTR